jgi:hypothetical protein
MVIGMGSPARRNAENVLLEIQISKLEVGFGFQQPNSQRQFIPQFFLEYPARIWVQAVYLLGCRIFQKTAQMNGAEVELTAGPLEEQP